MFRCCNCGNLFEDYDVKIVKESRGEFWGSVCYENMYYSPCCEDEYEEYIEEDEEEED